MLVQQNNIIENYFVDATNNSCSIDINIDNDSYLVINIREIVDDLALSLKQRMEHINHLHLMMFGTMNETPNDEEPLMAFGSSRYSFLYYNGA